jgi:hypothetical protein
LRRASRTSATGKFHEVGRRSGGDGAVNTALALLVSFGIAGLAVGIVLRTRGLAGRLAGWSGVVRRYRFDGAFEGPSITCRANAGPRIRRERWFMTVGVMAEGLYLATKSALPALDAPILVPWNALDIRNRHIAAFDLAVVYLGPEQHQLALQGGWTAEFEELLLAAYDAGK